MEYAITITSLSIAAGLLWGWFETHNTCADGSLK